MAGQVELWHIALLLLKWHPDLHSGEEQDYLGSVAGHLNRSKWTDNSFVGAVSRCSGIAQRNKQGLPHPGELPL